MIISGTSRGIGLGVARALIEDGHTVALFDVAPVQDTTILNCLKSAPDRVKTWQLDVADQKAVAQAIAEVLSLWGHVDVLINVAGAKLYSVFENITPGQFDQVVRTNLYGPYYLCREVVPTMKAQKYGKIVNMASRSGMEFYAEGTAYCASKAGLIGFSQSLADSLRGTGITVNVLCPSGVATPEYRQEQPDADVSRLTQVDEITDAIRRILQRDNRMTRMIWPFYNLRSLVKAMVKTGLQFVRWLPCVKIKF